MVRELAEAFEQARDDAAVRVVVLMGARRHLLRRRRPQGHAGSRRRPRRRQEATAASNRRFGALLEMADTLPKAVIALVEGAAMGGGVGLLAIADWVIAEKGAQIGTPEVTVGLVPAQITPFVVRRIGTATRAG